MYANPQKAHYERIHDAYERHYFDSTSLAYRRRFIFDQLLGNDDLSGKRVADVACGSGFNSLLLRERFPDLHTEGLDISAAACATYSDITGRAAHEVDMTKPLPSGITPFDAAIIVGGLHHCVADLDQALANLHALIRPGGRLYLIEPNADYAFEALRASWYRRDHYFEADTEQALSLSDLQRRASGFSPVRDFYFGGPAYFMIYNSLITRVPLGFKGSIAAPLFACESIWHRVLPNRMMAAFGAAWDRAA